MSEWVDPDTIGVPVGREGDIAKFLKSDALIRSGMCPNGHGLMVPCDYGQECLECGFSCNTLPDMTQH